MKKRCFRYLILLFLISPVAVPFAFSHEHEMSPAMEKQHQSMKAVGSQWQAFKKALQGGDEKAADKALAQILENTLPLEGFTLHRNVDKRQQFVERSRVFREKIVRLKDALQAGDGKQKRELEKAAGDDCVSCHTMFK